MRIRLYIRLGRGTGVVTNQRRQYLHRTTELGTLQSSQCASVGLRSDFKASIQAAFEGGRFSSTFCQADGQSEPFIPGTNVPEFFLCNGRTLSDEEAGRFHIYGAQLWQYHRQDVFESVAVCRDLSGKLDPYVQESRRWSSASHKAAHHQDTQSCHLEIRGLRLGFRGRHCLKVTEI